MLINRTNSRKLSKRGKLNKKGAQIREKNLTMEMKMRIGMAKMWTLCSS